MVSFVDVNWLAILVAAVVHMVIGAFWYSPVLFGKKWMHYSGITMGDMEKHKKDMWRSYIIAFVGALLMSYVLFHVVDYVGADDFMLGAQTGFWVWLGFIVPTLASSFLWEGKSFNLYLINIFYHGVTLALAGGILASWL